MKNYILPFLTAALISACSNESSDSGQQIKKQLLSYILPLVSIAGKKLLQ
jgi:hypothetical protein